VTAKLDQNDDTTADYADDRPATRPQIGDTIHALDAVTFAGHVWPRGSEIVLEQQHFDLATNRLGQCWLDDLSEAAQVARWGRQRFGLGTWPTDETGRPVPTWERGSSEWELARQRATAAAWSEADFEVRAAKLDEIETVFGALPTSWSHEYSTTASARAYEQQMRERAQRPVHRNVSVSSDGSRV
jgi:hypothetical protein